jgi:hypothetical protein
MSVPYWLGAVPQTVSQVVDNEITTTVNGGSNITVNVVPTVIESGASVNRKGNPNNTEVTFVTLSNVAPGYYMGSYAFNTDALAGATYGANDTMEYYFGVGGTEGVYTLIRPNNMKSADASEDCYVTGCAGFSNPTTQNITLNTYYSGTSAGVSTTCIFATIQKIG